MQLTTPTAGLPLYELYTLKIFPSSYGDLSEGHVRILGLLHSESEA